MKLSRLYSPSQKEASTPKRIMAAAIQNTEISMLHHQGEANIMFHPLMLAAYLQIMLLGMCLFGLHFIVSCVRIAWHKTIEKDSISARNAVNLQIKKGATCDEQDNSQNLIG